MDAVFALLTQLSEEKFFGAITLKLEDGRVVVIKKEQTLKPNAPDYRNNRGINDPRDHP